MKNLFFLHDFVLNNFVSIVRFLYNFVFLKESETHFCVCVCVYYAYIQTHANSVLQQVAWWPATTATTTISWALGGGSFIRTSNCWEKKIIANYNLYNIAFKKQNWWWWWWLFFRFFPRRLLISILYLLKKEQN